MPYFTPMPCHYGTSTPSPPIPGTPAPVSRPPPPSPCPCQPQVWARRFAQLPAQLQSAVLGASDSGEDRPLRSHLRLVCRQWRERVDAQVSKLVLDGRKLLEPPATDTALQLQRLMSGMPSLTSLSIQQLHMMGDLGSAPGHVPGQGAAEQSPFLFLLPSALTQLQSLVLGLSFLDEAQFLALGLVSLSQHLNLTSLTIVQEEEEDDDDDDDPKDTCCGAPRQRCGMVPHALCPVHYL